MCQEIGHVFGLGHTSGDDSSQSTCMDYSRDSSSSSCGDARRYGGTFRSTATNHFDGGGRHRFQPRDLAALLGDLDLVVGVGLATSGPGQDPDAVGLGARLGLAAARSTAEETVGEMAQLPAQRVSPA